MVSVVIPSYNSEKFINDTINSVLNQTYNNFLITVVDDKSTDKTVEIVNSFKDKRVKIVQNESNIGIINNFNKCLDTGKKAEYTVIMCNDDLLEKDYLEKKIEEFKKDDEVVLVSNATRIINEEGKKLLIRRNIKNEKIDGNKALEYSLKKGNIFGEPTCIMLKSKYIDKVGYFNEKLKHTLDWEYYIRFSMQGKVVFKKEILSSFRISNNSHSSKIIKMKDMIKSEHNIVSKEIVELLNKKESLMQQVKRNAIFETRYFAKIILFIIQNKFN